MNPIQTAILWGLASRYPQPTTTQVLFSAMYGRGCFGELERDKALVEFVSHLVYLEVIAEQINTNDYSCWLSDVGRAIVEALLAQRGITIGQMQEEIRDAVFRDLLAAAPETECARA